jgi:hypothetical protein
MGLATVRKVSTTLCRGRTAYSPFSDFIRRVGLNQQQKMEEAPSKIEWKYKRPKMASSASARKLWSPRMEEILGLSVRALDRARMSRDARFDGKFFIAITSTRIYCRPICPSPHAKRRHVRYYSTAAAAAAAGYRPCLRCRPEAAPGTPAWLGTSAVVRRALRLIAGESAGNRCPAFASLVPSTRGSAASSGGADAATPLC